MAILWAESMDKYSTSSDNDVFNDNFSWSGNTVSPGDMLSGVGRFGGNAYNCPSRQSSAHIRVPLSAMSGTTLIVGVAVRFGAAEMTQNGVQGIIDVYTAATGGAQHFSLGLTPAGSFVLFGAGSLATALANAVYSPPNVVYHNVWHWLELKMSLLDSGSYELRIDGATIMSGSGDFRDGTGNATTIDSIRLTGARSAGSGTDSVRYGTIIVLDGSGGSPYNDFLGDLRIENTVPNGNGATANWTPSNAGANYTNIDEAIGAYNDDTDYISSSTDDQINLATHADHVLSNANTIHFAQLSALARNDGSKNILLRTESGGTPLETSDITLGTAYKWCNQLMTVDPNTSAAWTLSGVNAAEWGVKLRP